MISRETPQPTDYAYIEVTGCAYSDEQYKMVC
jgi:hypothetical protein